MMKRTIKQAYDRIQPTTSARDRMRRNIQAAAEMPPAEYHTAPPVSENWRTLVPALMMLAVVLVGGIFLLNRNTDPAQTHLSSDSTTPSDTQETSNLLQTLMMEPFYQASVEWYDYVMSYDAADPAGDASYYAGYYGAEDSDMEAKLREILEKHGLTMDQDDLVGTDNLGWLLTELEITSPFQYEAGVTYDTNSFWYYRDGRFQFDASVTMTYEGTPWVYPVNFTFARMYKDILSIQFWKIGDLADYDCWEYTTASGENLLMALGSEQAVIIRSSAEDVVYVLVNNPRVGDIVNGEQSMSREALEAFADTLDYRLAHMEYQVEDTTVPQPSVNPLAANIAEDNCTVAATPEAGSIWQDDTGVYMNVTIYSYDMYDQSDISTLETGEYIWIRGQSVEVTSLEQDASGNVLINGGFQAGGYTLHIDENGVYCEAVENGGHYWQAWGTSTYFVSPDFEYRVTNTEGTHVETNTISHFLNEDIDWSFTPDDTTIVIENGCITALIWVCETR